MVAYRIFLISLWILHSSATPSSGKENLPSSEHADGDVNERALPSLILPSASLSPTNSLQSPGNAAPTEYSVFPKEANKVDEVFHKILTLSDGEVHTQRSPNRPEMKGVLYWRFMITEKNVHILREALGFDALLVETKTAGRRQEEAFIRNTTLQSNVTLNVTDKILPIGALFPQRDAPDDLKVVSWPPPPPRRSLDSLRNYVYNNDWRKNLTTYIIDSGVNPMNRDFRGRIRKWLYSDRATEMGIATEDDSDSNLHGSCVASKAVGLANGVYKRSNLVVVKIDPKVPIVEFVWAFDRILTDMNSGGNVNPAVVIFPILSEDNPNAQEWDQVRFLMQQIINRGGSIVVPAGNFREGTYRQNVDLLPAQWAGSAFPIIVAGAVGNTGALYSGSQGGPHVTIWAPGVGVRCAARVRAYESATGTSVSSGMVGGLIASALALEQVVFTGDVDTPRNVRLWLRNRARWARQPGGPPVIWNEIQGY